jgi:hypothetical protein
VLWIAKLVSLPFYWAGQLAAMFKQPVACPLLSLAFRISGDGAVGRTAVFSARTLQGPEAARALAAEWMRTRPRPEVAALAGLFAHDAGEPAVARAMLDRGRELGDDALGMLDLLEYFVVMGAGDASALNDLALRMEARSDLSSPVSLLIRKHLLWLALERRRFEEARGRANRLLEIEDVPEAEIAMWAAAKAEGHEAEADRHLARANLPPAMKVFLQIIGNRAIGREEDNAALLAQLRDLDAGLADRAEKRTPLAAPPQPPQQPSQGGAPS